MRDKIPNHRYDKGSQDLDIVLTAEFGMRYAVIGPMETSHLNSPINDGIREQVGIRSGIHERKFGTERR